MKKNYHFAFYTSAKRRTMKWGTLLAEGARVHGDKVTLVDQGDFEKSFNEFDGMGVLGIARFAKTASEAYLKAGKHCLFFDKGYFGKELYWRVSVDAWQPIEYFQDRKRPDDRLKRLYAAKIQFALQAQRLVSDTAPIVIAAPCQNYCNFFNLGNVNDFNQNTIDQVLIHTARPVVYRPNPSWYRKHNDEYRELRNAYFSDPLETTFGQQLDHCGLLITHGTSAAIIAVAAGVPVMVTGPGLARPMGLGPQDWDRLDYPHWPSEEERYQFFADMAYCQWTVKEYLSGEAWANIRVVLGRGS